MWGYVCAGSASVQSDQVSQAISLDILVIKKKNINLWELYIYIYDENNDRHLFVTDVINNFTLNCNIRML